MSCVFTIVTITYQNLAGLKKTADSIRAQDCKDYQWIVIDGRSDDGTREFLNARPAEECEWVSEPDQGIYDAMNKGIARAKGDYTIFMNAGDRFADESALSHIKRTIDKSSQVADFIYGDSVEQENYKSARSHERKEWGMFTHHQSMLYRTDLLHQFRYDSNHKIAADYHLTCCFLNCAERIEYLDHAICDFEPGGLSQRANKAGRKEQYQIRKDLKICPAPKNIWIYTIQSTSSALRQVCPAIYWRLRPRIKQR